MSTEAPPAPAPAATPPPTNGAPPTNGSGVSEPWAKEWIGSDFTLNPKALDRLPEHLKPLRPTLERQKTLEDVFVVMHNQQVMSGKKALSPLPADAPANVLAERKQLMDGINGVPAVAKDYNVTKPADLPDSAWHQPLADNVTAWAHKNSVAPAALKELIGLNYGFVKEQLQAQAEGEKQYWANEQKTFDATIRQQNIPADRASALVEKGASALGLDLTNEQTKIFMQGADARLMAMRHAIAVGEDTTVTTQSGSSPSDNNPAELAQQARSDPSNPLFGPYWNRDGKYSRASHDAAVEKVNLWLQQAAAKQQPAGARR